MNAQTWKITVYTEKNTNCEAQAVYQAIRTGTFLEVAQAVNDEAAKNGCRVIRFDASDTDAFEY